jgi:hypothetical protein
MSGGIVSQVGVHRSDWTLRRYAIWTKWAAN